METKYVAELIHYYELNPNERYVLCDGLGYEARKIEESIKIELENVIRDMLGSASEADAILLYSLLINLRNNPSDVCELEKILLESASISAENCWFAYWQIASILFLNPSIDTIEVKTLAWKLFSKAISLFKSKITINNPMGNVNEDFIVVLTNQFLGKEHGPTQTALDRCKTLLTQMHKNVLLINTADFMPRVGRIPWVTAKVSNYIDELKKCNTVEWQGISIPYAQCDNDMPNCCVIEELANTICSLAPKYIVDVGGNSVLGNILSDYIPVLAIGCVYSKLTITNESFQTYSRSLSSEDMQLLNNVGLDEKHVLVSVFSQGLREITREYTRKELGLPMDKVILAIVGGRLKQEIDDELINAIASLDDRYFVVTMGDIENESWALEKWPILSGRIRCLGFVQDVRGILTTCDLYINPRRNGGGISAVEAMSVGVPVVTINYGDVSVNAGEDFWVEDYSQMLQMIEKYCSDIEFYQIQSRKAIERADYIQNSDKHFFDVIKEFEKRVKEKGFYTDQP